MKLDIKKLQEFKARIDDAHRVLSNAQKAEDQARSLPLDDGVEIARQYYTFLDKNKEPYGAAALQVVNNSGLFGKVANMHLKTQAIFDGMNVKDFDSVRSKLVIQLATFDVDERIKNGGELDYEVIAKYHLDAFKICQLTPYAWGGLAVEELIGPGQWIVLHDHDRQGFQNMISCVAKYVAPSEYSVVTSHGYAIERMITSIQHSVACVLYKETPYAPISKGFDPAIIAAKFNVELSRIKYITDQVETIVWGMPFSDSSPFIKIYKILPKDPESEHISLSNGHDNGVEEASLRLFGIFKTTPGLQTELQNSIPESQQKKISDFVECLTGLAARKATTASSQDELGALFPTLSINDRKIAEDLALDAQHILGSLFSDTGTARELMGLLNPANQDLELD